MILRSYNDLLVNVLDRAEEEMGTGFEASEFYALASNFLDRTYLELLGHRPWMWARSEYPFIVAVQAPVEATISWPHGSHVATVSTPLPHAIDRWKLLIRGQPYRVVAHYPTLDPDALVMEMPWFGPDITGETVTAYKDEYDLVEIHEVPSAPTLALHTEAGGLAAGTYNYVLSWLGSVGETARGSVASFTVPADSAIRVSLPAPPSVNPYARGWGIYRNMGPTSITDTGNVYELLVRLYGDTRPIFPADYIDTTPAPLAFDVAPTPEGRNGTVRVRHIYGMTPKGNTHVRDVDALSEMELRLRYGPVPKPRWPPLAFARIAQDRILLSHYPSEDNVLEVFHTLIGLPLSLCTVNEILIPPQYRHVLADGALALLLEQKHSDRAQTWVGRMKGHVLEMEADDEKVKRGYDQARRGTRQEVGR